MMNNVQSIRFLEKVKEKKERARPLCRQKKKKKEKGRDETVSDALAPKRKGGKCGEYSLRRRKKKKKKWEATPTQ